MQQHLLQQQPQLVLHHHQQLLPDAHRPAALAQQLAHMHTSAGPWKRTQIAFNGARKAFENALTGIILPPVPAQQLPATSRRLLQRGRENANNYGNDVIAISTVQENIARAAAAHASTDSVLAATSTAPVIAQLAGMRDIAPNAFDAAIYSGSYTWRRS